jgi:hypothetical protein
MTADLIQRLRTCSTEERSTVAMELAQTRSDDGVRELQNMVEGGVRDYTDRTYRTFWLKIPIRYSVKDQYIGVEALGKTRRADVLDYLRRLYTPKVTTEGKESHVVQGVDPIDDYWKVEVYRYPNAPATLASALSYEVSLTTCSWSCESDIPQERIEQMRKDVPTKMKSHQIFREAIAKLESTI